MALQPVSPSAGQPVSRSARQPVNIDPNRDPEDRSRRTHDDHTIHRWRFGIFLGGTAKHPTSVRVSGSVFAPDRSASVTSSRRAKVV
jgi:hypothetical protein